MFSLYYPLAIYLVYLVYIHTNDSANYFQAAVEKLDLSSQTELAWKSLLEALSLNLYEGASEIQLAITELKENAQTSLQQADDYSLLFALLTALFLLVIYFFCKSRSDFKRIFNLHLILIALICLVIGVITPMLNLIAFKDIPVIGTVVFKYESKSIISVIHTLWGSQQYFISALMVFFSLLLPLGKLFISLFVLLSNQANIKQYGLRFIHLIGKWSMTDVFVIAVLLAFFTMNVDENTNAWLGHGLYYFASYALLSLWIGHAVSELPHAKKV